MGDPAGVGPEILVKAVCSGALQYPFIAVGDGRTLERVRQCLGLETLPEIPLADLGHFASPIDIKPGQIDAKHGHAAYKAIECAAQMTLAQQASALVTLPVNKEAVQLTVPGFTGHTEMIAEMCGQTAYTMMLSSDRLQVTHVSTHVSMREAIQAITKERVSETIALTYHALHPRFTNPRIAVAGLNAHAGENGLFGSEEMEAIRPAIEDARKNGLAVTGPYPPDTVFLRASKGEFDAVVCMYHDQGHIPLKLLDFHGGVNITLGLKIIRTSVDHGTAFDIAYQGKADPESFLRAFQMAADMVSENI